MRGREAIDAAMGAGAVVWIECGHESVGLHDGLTLGVARAESGLVLRAGVDEDPGECLARLLGDAARKEYRRYFKRGFVIIVRAGWPESGKGA